MCDLSELITSVAAPRDPLTTLLLLDIHHVNQLTFTYIKISRTGYLLNVKLEKNHRYCGLFYLDGLAFMHANMYLVSVLGYFTEVMLFINVLWQ